MEYKTIDLCAGIGGIRRGFELASTETGSFRNVLSAEIDSHAANTYKHLFKEDPTNDLTSEVFKRKVEAIEYDVLLAGFPCQTFSRQGKQMGFRDTTRGTIFFHIADIISRTNPKAVFLENVDNLVSHDKGNTIRTIIRTLEDELGYRVIGVTLDDNGNYMYDRSSFVRNTKYFGLPQNRPRTYIMAFSKRKFGRAIRHLNENLPRKGDQEIFSDLCEVLEEEVADKYYMAQGYLDTLKRHKRRNRDEGNGFGYCVVNQTKEKHPIANTILAIGGSGKERNLIYQPKEGIAGKRIKGKKTPLNNEGIRTMIPEEWGRLQGFIGYAFMENGKDTFTFPHGMSDTQKYKQFGNSVSIPVIRKMADFMLHCFEVLMSQQDEVVRALAQNNNSITKRNVMEMLDISETQATGVLNRMIQTGELRKVRCGRINRYVMNDREIAIGSLGQEDRIVSLVKQSGNVSNKDVAEELGITKESANTLLSKMVRVGTLVRRDRGRYILGNIAGIH